MMTGFTEKALAATLKEMLEHQPLDRITVRDLTEKCGVSRNTFYYHFHDVYELTSSYFIGETERIINRYEEEQNWEGGFLEGLNMLYDSRKMIEHIIRSVNRENLDAFLNKIVFHHAEIIIHKTVKPGVYSEKTISIVTDFYKNAIIGAVMQWIDRGMKEEPRDLAALYSSVFSGTVVPACESVSNALETISANK